MAMDHPRTRLGFSGVILSLTTFGRPPSDLLQTNPEKLHTASTWCKNGCGPTRCGAWRRSGPSRGARQKRSVKWVTSGHSGENRAKRRSGQKSDRCRSTCLRKSDVPVPGSQHDSPAGQAAPVLRSIQLRKRGLPEVQNMIAATWQCASGATPSKHRQNSRPPSTVPRRPLKFNMAHIPPARDGPGEHEPLSTSLLGKKRNETHVVTTPFLDGRHGVPTCREPGFHVSTLRNRVKHAQQTRVQVETRGAFSKITRVWSKTGTRLAIPSAIRGHRVTTNDGTRENLDGLPRRSEVGITARRR